MRSIFIILIAVCAFLPFPSRAQTFTNPCPSTTSCDQGQAYSACKAAIAFWRANYGAGNNTDYQCKLHANKDRYYIAHPQQTTCSALQGVPCAYMFAGLCDARPQQNNWMWGSGPVCYNGCSYLPLLTPDGGAAHAPSGSVCTTADAPEPKVDSDQDGTPDESDAFPNDPNEQKDADGDGVGDNADHSPNDPDDGKDGGQGDEGDNESSGGGDCKSRPTCKGDSIQCNQLFQQWSIRCSGATVTGDPTNCTGAYTCAGDPPQCAQLALLRKSACNSTTTTPKPGVGDGNSNGVPDLLEGSGDGQTGDPGPSDDVTKYGLSVNTSLIDTENIFGGGSCPQPPSITIMGKTVSGADFPHWCQAMSILRACILIFGAWTALQILIGRTV